MTEESSMDKFCGGTFWDVNVTWNSDLPDFTRCFERTVLVWVPCAFLWLFALMEVFYLKQSLDRLVPWTWINIFKTVVSTALLILQAIDFFWVVQKSSSGETVFGVDYAAPAILFSSFLLQLIFVLMEKKRGIQSSGYIFIFWFLIVLFGIPEYRTYFLNNNNEQDNTMSFVIYMVYFPLVVIMLILNCFADHTPQYVHYKRGEKSSPEMTSSFFNRVVFAWIDPLIWRGYRRPVVRDDLWTLSYENASEYVVSVWDKNFRKTQAKAEKKAESDMWASRPESANHIEMSKPKGPKQHISILPTMVRTFGPSFLFGAILKLIYDLLQFTSPILLNYLIAFTDSTNEDEPAWHGYFYAALMFIAAQLQSFVLGQYFMKMFLIGLRVRTGVISAVYKKALRISSSARKESTVGEIVNLMSVDAQRFMDLTTYLNLLWSAPLQIAICLYLLWNLLDIAVLAGVAVLIALIPINGFIAGKTKQLQISQMKSKDKRVKLMNEILNGIKVLKLYAWEPSFEDQVLDVRSKEIKVLRKAAYLSAGTSFIWACTPFLVALASFATFVTISVENVLNAQTAFVALSLFNLLRFPISMMPMLVTNMVQASVSLKRLNKFLNADELDSNSVSRDSNTSKAISIENGTFAWGHDEDDKAVLRGINVDIDEGSLVAVVGTVGAGKSSLCSAILGEMEKESGRVNVKGSVAYVAQQAWIQNATLENNILFNKEKDSCYYEKCIKACALQADLDMLPGGDQTEIGEKGINLSGGQKQRVSLARAVYADTKIYLLDDPLSAVDSHVGKHIFEHVIGPEGVLSDKTRILVTHSVTYLPQVDRIIVLKDGVISEQGTYAELLGKKGEFQAFLLEYLSEAAEEEDGIEGLEDLKNQLADNMGREVFQRQISRISERKESESENPEEFEKNAENIKRDSVRRRTKKISECEKGKEAKPAAPPPPKAGEKLIEAEKTETGKVSMNVYTYYIKAVGIWSFVFTILFGALSQASTVGANMWLTAWSEDNSTFNGTQDTQVRDKYLGVYGALGACQAIFTCSGSLVIARGTIMASAMLHAFLLGNVFRCPMSFFDVTPVGRLVNRFAKDMDTIDVLLPSNFRSWLACLLSVISTFVAIIYATPIFVAVIIPMMIIYYFIQVVYVSTSRQLKRLESVSRSPIYSHFQETIQGASTVRAYERQHQFIKMSEAKVDYNQVSYFPNVMANRWLAIRLEFIGNILTFFAALFAVMSKGTISSGLVGFSVSYALSVTQILNWLVRMTSDVETNIVAVERIKEYTETKQEAPWDIPNNKPDKEWPQKGVVSFNNYSTRYREGLDLVVKDINCRIESGEKVGIVGRTGAGKSSLTLALFRIIESAGGNITLDGVDISKIGLHDLRNGLTIIPQDPVLFSGSLRMNLDPFNSYNDDQVWSALEHSHLKNFVAGLANKLQHEVAEGGDNLSVGQRQLVCLARALLRKSQILILDEATAAVDLETDALIQETIRREFDDCTVLTIAHRLNTIMDSTRVLVLDKGVIKEFDTPGDLLKNPKTIFYGMAKDAGLV